MISEYQIDYAELNLFLISWFGFSLVLLKYI